MWFNFFSNSFDLLPFELDFFLTCLTIFKLHLFWNVLKTIFALISIMETMSVWGIWARHCPLHRRAAQSPCTLRFNYELWTMRINYSEFFYSKLNKMTLNIWMVELLVNKVFYLSKQFPTQKDHKSFLKTPHVCWINKTLPRQILDFTF